MDSELLHITWILSSENISTYEFWIQVKEYIVSFENFRKLKAEQKLLKILQNAPIETIVYIMQIVLLENLWAHLYGLFCLCWVALVLHVLSQSPE